jgi:hypothetical protein
MASYHTDTISLPLTHARCADCRTHAPTLPANANLTTSNSLANTTHHANLHTWPSEPDSMEGAPSTRHMTLD